MKLGLREYSNHTSGSNAASKKVTIDSNGIAFYGQMSGLAKDKIGYGMREINTNAWDASRGDFDVQLPTDIDPVFRVRDRGPGMTPELIDAVFLKMYASTKREDTNQVGGWGLGRFSPFAYLLNDEGAGSYNVTSWTGGFARYYTVAIAEDGSPELTEMLCIESDEPTGMEISYAVRQEDIWRFHDAARRILWSFNPRPNILPAGLVEWDEPVIRNQGEKWTRYKNDTVPFRGPHVRMGCVMYPIDLRQIQTSGFLDSSDLVLFEAEIGSLKPTLSREELAYDTRTKATLEALAKSYEETFISSAQEKVSACGTYFEACDVFHDEAINMGSSRIERLKQLIFWRGREMTNYVPKINMKMMQLEDGWRTFEKFSDEVVSTSWAKNAKVVIEHNPSYSLQRFILGELQGEKILWVRCKRFYRDNVINALGNPEVIDLDSFKVKLGAGEKRPKTHRKRKVIKISENGVFSRDVEIVDMSVPHIYVLQTSGGRRNYHHEYRISQTGSSIRWGNLMELLDASVEFGIIQKGATILIKNVEDDLVDGSEWLADEIRDPLISKVDISEFTGLRKKSIHNLDGYLQSFRRVALSENAPADVATFHADLSDLCEKLTASGSSVNTESDKAFYALQKLGHKVQIPEVECPIEAIQRRWEALKDRYMLISDIMQQHYYGSRAATLSAHLNHYFDLLGRSEFTTLSEPVAANDDDNDQSAYDLDLEEQAATEVDELLAEAA